MVLVEIILNINKNHQKMDIIVQKFKKLLSALFIFQKCTKSTLFKILKKKHFC